MLHAVLAIAVVGIACSDDVSPEVTEWTAVLSGANEVPAVAGSGAATADFALDASGDSIDYTVTITAPLSSTVTQAHIHTGATTANGNISVWLCHTSGGTNVPANTPACAAGTANGVLITGRVAVPGNTLNSMRVFGTYVNVHTSNNTGGEVRGQLRNVETAQ